MGHCETCEWYKKPTSYTCSCPKMSYGYSVPTYKGDDGLSIEDDEGWGMRPGPKFGCIHHTKRN